MLWKVKRRCRPTTLMLVLGFAISMTAVLIGISVIHDLLESLASAGQEAPILQTIQNSGLSLALRIYLFSMVNCMTAANFWVITRRRDLAVCKAFGWPGARIIGAVVGELAGILLISLGLGLLLTAGLSHLTSGVLSIHITPFFLGSTLLLLLFTLAVSAAVPVVRILGIHPAEVIG